MNQFRIEETHAQQELVLSNPMCFVKETIPLGQRKWADILANKLHQEDALSTEISKLVMRLGRRYDQDDRKVDGAVHWNSTGPRLRNAFLKYGSSEFSDLDWLNTSLAEAARSGSYAAWVPKFKNSLLYIRAIQGHTGGRLIAPELLGHVAIPYNWKEFTFHKGSSFDCSWILKPGLVAGGKTSKDGRQTVFFAPLNPIFETVPGEVLTSDDFTRPRMEHYRCKWRPSQDSVYWVSSVRAQDEGSQFWQTRSNAIVVFSSVPSECI